MQSVQKTTTIQEEWDGHKEVRSLIEHTDELYDLYQKLGYSPDVEQMARLLLEKLNDIEVNISDFQGFQKSLDEVLVALERFRSGQEKLDPLIFADSGLFEQVVESRRDKERILSLLNKNFREKLPIHIESSVIVRRPRDPDAFLSTLGELEKLFGKSWLPQSTETRNDLLEKIKEVRKELQRENWHVLTALESLNSEIERTCFNIADWEANEKKRQLDELLWTLVYTRHEYKPQEPYFVEGVIEDVKKYWDNPWMHTPWLTRFALRHLLEAEIAKNGPHNPFEEPPHFWKAFVIALVVVVGGPYINRHLNLAAWPVIYRFVYPCAWLIIALVILNYTIGFLKFAWRSHKFAPLVPILDEISSGSYHSPDLARRLRNLEQKGIFVHSLILGLLELQ